MTVILPLRLQVSFLSTPSARRATTVTNLGALIGKFLSTPSARRATDGSAYDAALQILFLSTPSARRATTLERRHNYEA